MKKLLSLSHGTYLATNTGASTTPYLYYPLPLLAPTDTIHGTVVVPLLCSPCTRIARCCSVHAAAPHTHT